MIEYAVFIIIIIIIIIVLSLLRDAEWKSPVRMMLLVASFFNSESSRHIYY